jgi:dTDP-4-amino-4,6-dideoxygalactose transaminase
MRKLEAFSIKRFENGMKLIAGLKNSDGIILPKVQKNSRPAFNRLPILFKDLNKKKEAARRLWQAGVETSLMYCKPLHHMFDLGYDRGDFPNAVYLAEHLLTLPVHPSVEEKDLFTMIDIIRT